MDVGVAGQGFGLTLWASKRAPPSPGVGGQDPIQSPPTRVEHADREIMMRAFGPLIGRGPPEPSTRGQIFRPNKPADPRVPGARHRPQCGAAARCLSPRAARKAPHVMTAAGTGSKQQRVRRLYIIVGYAARMDGRSKRGLDRHPAARSIDYGRAYAFTTSRSKPSDPLKSLQLMSSQDLRWGRARLISAGLGVSPRMGRSDPTAGFDQPRPSKSIAPWRSYKAKQSEAKPRGPNE